MLWNAQSVAILIVTLASVLKYTDGANILYLNDVASPSHHIWNSAIVNALAARGHNVTYVSPDLDKNPPKNVHYIHMAEMYNEAYYEFVENLIKDNGTVSPVLQPYFFTEYMLQACKEVIKTRSFKTLLAYPDDFRFDLIINDFTQGNCLLGFLHKFKYPPLLSVTAFSQPPYLNAFIGGHHYSSYVPHYAVSYHGDMDFFQRFYNFVVNAVEIINWRYVFIPKLDKIFETAFGSKLPSMIELQEKTALAFVSTAPVFDIPQSLPKNVIDVGGLHIRDPKPLPKDLDDFIMSSRKGAVLFTLGSNFRSSGMGSEHKKMILDAFEQFPDYHFMWKFEKPMDDMRLPRNVIIRPWLPQSDLLANTRTKAFITHSGLLGTLEAVWRGVPMIGMPFSFDQNQNIRKCIDRGVGEQINFKTLTTEKLVDKLRLVLEDPTYAENAKQLSARFRDQKETPIERAVWWAEWLIRNPDCEHLKSPVLRLGYIAGNSYDVIAAITIAIFLVLWISFKSFVFFFKLFIRSSKSRPEKLNDKLKRKKQN